MNVSRVHEFDFDKEEDFIKLQNILRGKIVLKNLFDENKLTTCAGVDLAYWEFEGVSFACCCIVVLNYLTKEVIEKVHSWGRITVPYVAGFLAFRELPLIIEAACKLIVEPDLFMFDGNGYLHYNNMGIATHSSFFLNKPTIGIAKSYLKIDQVAFIMPENEQGAYTDIIINNETYGRALRTHNGVKPIFLSCGNYIDLVTSYKITMNLINKDSRLPLPVRFADIETHKIREETMKAQLLV